ncbi:MAG: OmpA family protein [Pseudomonadota bacterium]|nr:OmpA family protein [Pseudomonadota bacterium]
MKASRMLAFAGLLCCAAPIQAQQQDESRLLQGLYAAPMYSYIEPDNDRLLDSGSGGTLALGYRFNDAFAFELFGAFSDLDREAGGTESTTMSSYGIGALAFLTDHIYLPFGVSYVDTEEQGQMGTQYDGVAFDAGIGALLPLSFGRYDFAIRAEARYRHNNGQDSDDADEFRRSGLEDALFNVGLQLPFGLRPEPPPPVEPEVAVVPVLAVCADGIDNDSDGLVDFPNDPGCSSAADGDETDPPQCSDGVDNDGDGRIDHPDDPGCSAPADTDETDPCRTPAPGEALSLGGCGTGDVIVLNGVNFEFDRSRLTIDARTILDGVAAELQRYPAIEIEIGGHTDARGGDAYNQGLSEQRAAAVVDYLAGKGVDAARMTPVGYGEARPVADNDSEEGRERNRRVELTITAGIVGD